MYTKFRNATQRKNTRGLASSIFAFLFLGISFLLLACDPDEKEEVKKYTVTFDAKEGNFGTDADGKLIKTKVVTEVAEDATVAEPKPKPTLANHALEGWYEQSDLSGAKFVFASTKITGNITLYAKWTRNYYTVTFDAKEGNFGSDKTKVVTGVASGTTVAEPKPKPTLANHALEGWYIKSDTSGAKFNFATTKITGKITLHAKWTRNYHTVTFDAKEGNFGTDADGNLIKTKIVTRVASGTTVSEPDPKPTLANHALEGWYEQSDLSGTKFVFGTATITRNITLHAKWTRNYHTVTFDAKRGSAVDSVRVASGSTITAPSSTLANHFLDNWYAQSDFSGAAFVFGRTTITDNITLYAKWIRRAIFQAPRYTLYHNGNFYVSDNSLDAVVKVDATDGDRREIFSKEGVAGKGSGLALVAPLGIAYHNDNFYVNDSDLDAIVKVNPTTGDREIFSKEGAAGRGSGLALGDPLSIAYYNNNFYVTDGSSKAIIKVHATSGDREIFSQAAADAGVGGTATGTGAISLDGVNGIVFHNNNFYVTTRTPKAVVKIDATTGNREIFSQAGVAGKGTGPALGSPFGIAYHNNNFYVTDDALKAVVKVSSTTRDREIFSQRANAGAGVAGRGTGPSLGMGFSIFYHNNNFYVVNSNVGNLGLVKVDITTGNRVAFSTNL